MSRRGQRNNSISQLNRALPIPIELYSESSEALDSRISHITNVLVGDYHLIGGESGKPYIMWAVRIVLDNTPYSSITVYKRYSDFVAFRARLLEEKLPGRVPELPPKDNFSLERLMMKKQWMEDRRKGLQWFLSNVLLNPKYQSLEVVYDFILK